ncbi:hypothetical protein ABPG72_000203 [Tetrahymena utriculariae]
MIFMDDRYCITIYKVFQKQMPNYTSNQVKNLINKLRLSNILAPSSKINQLFIKNNNQKPINKQVKQKVKQKNKIHSFININIIKIQMNLCKNSKNNSSIFKVSALGLIDRIKNLEQYAIQVSKIAYQDEQRSQNLENLLDNQDNLVQDIYSIISLKNKIKRYTEVVAVLIKMINEYEEICLSYQELYYEQKQILSKISINKEIFKRCKIQFEQIQKYFFNSQCLIQILQKQINEQ